ncbi:hypothetical protein J437_LFUL012111 [Ladona fulva]|uniref:Uncharacterized protein n=1 Tax=Ladona fulva TaxID=123851 RepID=A0A8K0KCN0_LADFU|nr:hypothetical protein J437_LFUL012111 [Ladona fulva]
MYITVESLAKFYKIPTTDIGGGVLLWISVLKEKAQQNTIETLQHCNTIAVCTELLNNLQCKLWESAPVTPRSQKGLSLRSPRKSKVTRVQLGLWCLLTDPANKDSAAFRPLTCWSQERPQSLTWTTESPASYDLPNEDSMETLNLKEYLADNILEDPEIEARFCPIHEVQRMCTEFSKVWYRRASWWTQKLKLELVELMIWYDNEPKTLRWDYPKPDAMSLR